MKEAAEDLHTIVLGHGHGDHTQGLMGMIRRLGERKIPLLLRLDAFLQRKLVFPDGHELNLPPPNRQVLSSRDLAASRSTGYGAEPCAR